LSLLLDTHVFLWWLDDDPRLGGGARARIADPAAAVFVSAATAWEIAIKSGLGRLHLAEPAEDFVPREIERGGFRPLPVTVDHALAVRTLAPHHRDPFDGLLIAQARCEGLRIVTADAAFAAYGIATLAAER
jgi:PIN domain nuclease of toxin-antitoxin system